MEIERAEYETREEGGAVEVCVTLDTPIDSPLTVQLQVLESTPISAEGMGIYCVCNLPNL